LYAAILFSASLVITSFVTDFRALGAARLLTGFAAGAFSTCSIAYVGDYFPYERRGVAMSVVQAGYFAALVIGIPVANLLAGWKSWRLSFIFFGALAAIAFVLVATRLPDERKLSGAGGAPAPRGIDNIRQALATRERVAGVFAALFVSGGFVGFLFYLGTWLGRDLQRSRNEVSLFFILVGFASLVGAFVAGPVSDKVGKRSVSIVSTIALAGGLVLVPRLNWGIPLFVTFLVASLAFAFRQGPLQALATELVPQHARGAFVAVRNTASQIGIALSTNISGTLYDRYGYVAVAVMSGAVTLAAALCIALMREPRAEKASD
jgi:predicted MFS family arabinose efflux permease